MKLKYIIIKNKHILSKGKGGGSLSHVLSAQVNILLPGTVAADGSKA